MRICPSFFGTAIIGETQGVTSLSGTGSIISCFSSSSIAVFTFSRKWFCIRRWGCAFGNFVSSIFNLICVSGNLPRPENTAAFF